MSIARDIYLGKHDDELEAISTALKQRNQQLSVAKMFDLAVGDTVRFNNSTKPKYLVGKEGVIRKKNRKTVVVDLHEPYTSTQGRTWYKNIRVPLSLVEQVEVGSVDDAFNRITSGAMNA